MMSSYGKILEGLLDERQAVTEKANEYRKYIEVHKSGVVEAYNHYMVPIQKVTKDKNLIDAIIQAGKNVQFHDLSKYEPIEFEAYRRHWHPTESEKNDKSFLKITEEMYKVAWEHHHKVNQHHPEHWYIDRNKEDMPLHFIIEMLCDWLSVGAYKNTSTKEWWKSDKTQNKEGKCMTDFTKTWVNALIYDIIPNIP